MTSLDDPAQLALDSSGMFGHIAAVGFELRRAWELARKFEPPADAESANAVVIAAMGGSATAGDYFAALAAEHASVPVVVVREPVLPNWVSNTTLVIAISYSGNTAETLTCYDDAWKRGAMLLGIARGGTLLERARQDTVRVQLIDYDSPPRAAMAHGLGPLLVLGAKLDLLPHSDIEAAAGAHTDLVANRLHFEIPEAANGAKSLARALEGRVPFVVAAAHLTPVARRFKNQLAENAKVLAATESLPEAGHNWVCGLDSSPEAAVVTLESRHYPAAIARRFDALAEQAIEAGLPHTRIPLEGKSLLADLLLATAWGDYTSCYLALLRGVDPTPIPRIERMRSA